MATEFVGPKQSRLWFPSHPAVRAVPRKEQSLPCCCSHLTPKHHPCFLSCIIWANKCYFLLVWLSKAVLSRTDQAYCMHCSSKSWKATHRFMRTLISAFILSWRSSIKRSKSNSSPWCCRGKDSECQPAFVPVINATCHTHLSLCNRFTTKSLQVRLLRCSPGSALCPDEALV